MHPHICCCTGTRGSVVKCAACWYWGKRGLCRNELRIFILISKLSMKQENGNADLRVNKMFQILGNDIVAHIVSVRSLLWKVNLFPQWTYSITDTQTDRTASTLSLCFNLNPCNNCFIYFNIHFNSLKVLYEWVCDWVAPCTHILDIF